MEANRLTISEARRLLDSGELTATKLLEDCLAQIEKADKRLQAVLTLNEAEARLAASRADERLAAGEKGSLLGIPYLAKDNLLTKGLRTTASSRILEKYVAPYNATVINKLDEAGAILLGKTNLDEFAHGGSTETSAFGPTHNPWDLTRVPGGSSGGSAAAVAADFCLFALGSDTGGSIRQPAAFCGVVGFKPAYGAVSRFGLISMTSSTDVIGPITKTVKDAALVYEVIAGADTKDANTYPGGRGIGLKEDISGLRVGLPKEYYDDSLNPQIAASLEQAKNWLVAAGAVPVELSLPNTKYAIPAYYVITPSEISSNLARFDGVAWGYRSEGGSNLDNFYKKNRGFGFGAETKRRIMLGTFSLSSGYYEAYYKKAQAVRTLINQDFADAFLECDILLVPTQPHPAFKLGEKNTDPLSMYLEDIYLTAPSLAGLPAISIPVGLIEKDGIDLPIGAQLIAPLNNEGHLLSMAQALEARVAFMPLKFD